MNNSANFKKQMICYILIGISLLLILLGFYHLHTYNKYVKDGDKVQAIVENILVYPDANGVDYENELEHYNALLNLYRSEGVIGKSTTVAIIISYAHNGNIYEKELGYFSDDIKIGNILTIYVNKDNSKDFVYEGENKFGLYFCMIVGSVLLLCSLIFILIFKHNNKCDMNLLKFGNKIQAEILYADVDEKKSLFGKHPYIFTCIYKNEQTGEEQYFTSDSLYCKNQGSTYISKKIDIYVDPNDNKNFYIDAKFFEKQ